MSPTPPASGPPTAELEYPDEIDGAVLKVAGVVVIGSIMSILDITVVNVALPTFQRVFADGGANLDYSLVAWTVTAYTLALATVIPATGWAADRFGTKRLYMVAIALFTIGSVLCAAAWDINSLIAFRVVQGLGGGMLMPLGMTIMTKAAGPRRMGRLMAILGIPMMLGPIGGPILGGWLIDAASWHWIFLINLPLGIAALIYAYRALPRDEQTRAESFDFLGMALLSPGLALFLYGISSIPGEGTVMSAKVLLTAIVGVALITAFVFHSFKPAHPLLDLRLFRNRNLTLSIVTMFLFAAAFFGGLLLVPTYFQQVRGETTTMAGILMITQGVGAIITMPIAGTLVDRIPIGRIVPVGLSLIIVGMFPLTMLDEDTSYWVILSALFVMGLGMGSVMMPLFTSALRTLRTVEIARGSTLLNISQQIASSVGVAVMSVILTNQLKGSDAVSAANALAEAKQNGVPAPSGVIELVQGLGDRFQAVVIGDSADAFAATFMVAWLLVILTLVPALMLPRRTEVSHVADDEEGVPPVMIH